MADNPHLEAIKTLLSGVSKSQESINKKLTDLSIQVEKIIQTVCGDEEFGHQGLVKQVENLNKDMEKQKLSSAKIMGGLAVIGVLWTMLLKAFKF